MKQMESILVKMNDLLIMTNEVEKIYRELLSKTEDTELKPILRDWGFERNEFGKDLKLEILKLGGVPTYTERIHAHLYKYWMNFRNFLLLEDDINLLNELHTLKALNVKKYNDILQEISLPLSTCKLLIKQRDLIENAMDMMERQQSLIVA